MGRAVSMAGGMAVVVSLLAMTGARKAISGPGEMLWRFVTTSSESINILGVLLACLLLGAIVYAATYIPIQNTWPDVEDRPHDILYTSFQVSKILWMAVVLFLAWMFFAAVLPDSTDIGLALRRGVNDTVEESARLVDLFILCMLYALAMYLTGDLPYNV